MLISQGKNLMKSQYFWISANGYKKDVSFRVILNAERTRGGRKNARKAVRSFAVALQNDENRVQWMQHDSFGFILEDSRYAGIYTSSKILLGGYGHLCGDCACRGDGAGALHHAALPRGGQTAPRGANHRHRKQAEQREKIVERHAFPRRFSFRDVGGFFAERRNARRARRDLRRDAVHQ